MTLKELKSAVKNERNKTMGVKQIEQLNMGKILELQSSERKLVIYEEDYAVYFCMVGDEMHSTVLKVHDLELRNEYTYNYEKPIKLNNYPEFDDMDAVPVLCMCAEDRIERNTYERTRAPFYIDSEGCCYANPDKDGYSVNEDPITPHAEDFVENLLDKIVEENSRREMLKKLRKAMKKLTKAQREVIDLYFYKEMTQDEIAEKLNIKRTSVQSRLDCAMKKLRKLMS